MEQSSIKKYIHPCIAIVLMLVGFIIPPPAPITEMGIAVVFIFIGMIWGWSTCGMLWPSLLGIVLLGFTEYAATPEAALGLMLTNSTFVASLVAFVLFAFINSTGLMAIVAKWIVTRKFAAGKPWTFIAFFLIALSLFAPFAGNLVVLILLGFNFMAPILKQMGYTKEDALPTYMMLGIGITGVCSVWPNFMPSSIFVNGIIATAVNGGMLNLVQYTMCLTVPLLLSVVLYILVGKFVVRIDTTKFAEGTKILLESEENKIQLTSENKSGAIVLILFILGMVLPSILPKTLLPIQLLSKAGIVGVCIIITVALLILNKKDGKTIGDFAEMMKGISWDMVILIGAIMVIANALVSGGTGVIAFVSGIAVPLLSKMSLVGFVIGVCVFMCTISQFSMNMVLQMIFAPILAKVMMAAGYNPMIAVMAVFFGTQWAFLAPSGSMMSALVFGNTEWVNKKHLYKIAVPWIILCLVMSVVFSLTIPDLFCSNLTP